MAGAGETGDVAKEVAFDELFLWNPKFLAAVVNDCILVRVAVSDEGTGGGGKEVGEYVR